jgi:hypothetical protein
MDIFGFIPVGNAVNISATTSSTVNQLATTPMAGNSLRVVNEAGASCLVSISNTTSPDATADAKTMSVPSGTERIFGWQGNYNSVSIALRAGSGTVQIQLGKGF